MRLRALIAAGLGSLAIAGILGGCGSSAVVVDPLARAAEATSNVGGAHTELSARIQGTGLPQPVSLDGGGYFNFSTHEGTLTVQLTGFPSAAGLGSQPTMQEIYKGSDLYVGSSLFAGELPTGAKWMKIDISRLGQAAGLNPSQLLNGESNPTQILQYLKASGASVAEVGTQRIRGVPTTHYSGTINIEKAAAALGGAADGAAQKAVSTLGVSDLPVDVWVDSHDLVRRLQVTLSTPPSAGHLQVQINLELFDFGATPPVSVPAASETFEASSTGLSGLAAAAE
ncbi:MAG TPA: hypothetical protein VMB91_12900 [Solirubrobacteraceae bacterium]|nr:hypothetical protein [Solirubrobacteraceae bacterium]